MAYFSNGTEGRVFDEECSECILGNDPCPIALVQGMFNYDACNNKTARAILNDLVKQGDDFEYLGCQMKPFLDKLVLNEIRELAEKAIIEIRDNDEPETALGWIDDIIALTKQEPTEEDIGNLAAELEQVLSENPEYEKTEGGKWKKRLKQEPCSLCGGSREVTKRGKPGGLITSPCPKCQPPLICDRESQEPCSNPHCEDGYIYKITGDNWEGECYRVKCPDCTESQEPAKVICNMRHVCPEECGAKQPHAIEHCEQCPRKEQAKCTPVSQAPDHTPEKVEPVKEWEIHLECKTEKEFYTELRALIPADLFLRTKITEPVSEFVELQRELIKARVPIGYSKTQSWMLLRRLEAETKRADATEKELEQRLGIIREQEIIIKRWGKEIKQLQAKLAEANRKYEIYAKNTKDICRKLEDKLKTAEERIGRVEGESLRFQCSCGEWLTVTVAEMILGKKEGE